MPTPGKDESKNEFISRCISEVRDEGIEQEEAVGRCHGIWESAQGKSVDPDALITFGGAVKALGDGRVGGHIVRFSPNRDEIDIQGEFFTTDTDFGGAAQSDVYYNHGLDPKIGKRRLTTGQLKTDDLGVWIEAQLDLHDRYAQAVYQLVERGALGWSSGSAPHLVQKRKSGMGWEITRWPLGIDASLTPTPAEPRNAAMPLKSWAETMTATDPGLEVVAQEDVSQTSSVSTTAGGDVHVHVTVTNQKAQETPKSTEGTTMSEKEEVKAKEPETKTAPGLDVESMINKAVSDAVKAVDEKWEKRLAEEPPSRTGGFLTVKAREDRALEGNPFSLGTFLVAVKNANAGLVDERLLPVRSDDGYNLTKAVGDELVGNLYEQPQRKAAIKQTGLAEGTGALGGFLVDTDHRLDIMGRVYEMSQLLQRVSMFRVSANSNAMTFNADAETSRADGSRRGGVRGYWLAEAGTKTASYPTFRQIELKLKKCAALVYATDELLADASALESYIMRIMPEELSFIVEDSIYNGTGVGMPQGILASGCLVSVAKETGQAATTIVSENISKMWARMWGPSRRNAVWLYNQDCEPQLRGLTIAVGTGGVPVYLPPGGYSAAPYGTIFGRPAIPVEYAATLGTQGDIMLADLSQYFMIEKGGVEMASSIHVNFVYDESVYRFVYRVDGQPSWNSALTPYKGTNTLSPFVVLDTRS